MPRNIDGAGEIVKAQDVKISRRVMRAIDDQFVSEAITRAKERRSTTEGQRQWRVGFAREVAMEAMRLKSEWERYQA
jgi:hypothetical protein